MSEQKTLTDNEWKEIIVKEIVSNNCFFGEFEFEFNDRRVNNGFVFYDEKDIHRHTFIKYKDFLKLLGEVMSNNEFFKYAYFVTPTPVKKNEFTLVVTLIQHSRV